MDFVPAKSVGEGSFQGVMRRVHDFLCEHDDHGLVCGKSALFGRQDSSKLGSNATQGLNVHLRLWNGGRLQAHRSKESFI